MQKKVDVEGFHDFLVEEVNVHQSSVVPAEPSHVALLEPLHVSQGFGSIRRFAENALPIFPQFSGHFPLGPALGERHELVRKIFDQKLELDVVCDGVEEV